MQSFRFPMSSYQISTHPKGRKFLFKRWGEGGGGGGGIASLASGLKTSLSGGGGGGSDNFSFKFFENLKLWGAFDIMSPHLPSREGDTSHPPPLRFPPMYICINCVILTFHCIFRLMSFCCGECGDSILLQTLKHGSRYA